MQEVCEKFQVTDQEVHAALLSGDVHDQLSIAYHLVLDNKKFDDESMFSIQDFYRGPSSDARTGGDKVHPERIMPSSERIADGQSKEDQVPPMPPSDAAAKKASGHAKRAKWHLGIRSQSKPQDIMHEVYR